MLRDELDDTFLVINGDVLTDLSLASFSACHRTQGNIATVATSLRRTKTDFGVIEQVNGRITSFKEKPVLTNLVSMGVYCMEPEVLSYIPQGVPFGFDDLILCLLAEGVRTGTFLHDGLWLDIGRIDDFQSAQALAWDEQPPAFEEVAVVA
jgi:mannose-1-phosphate guanylyltransferase